MGKLKLSIKARGCPVNMKGSWNLNLICMTFGPGAFSITPCQEGEVWCPVFSCLFSLFILLTEEDLRPLGIMRKVENSVLVLETKLVSRPL
jgi:hypothetical protein